jgi:hypothetical protein
VGWLAMACLKVLIRPAGGFSRRAGSRGGSLSGLLRWAAKSSGSELTDPVAAKHAR